MNKKQYVGVATLALIVAVAGCAQNSGQSGANTSGESAAQPPLDALLGDAYSLGQLSDEEAEAQMKESQRIFDETVVKCMAEQGFEYKVGGNAGRATLVGFDDDMPQTPDEWIERAHSTGYGLSDTGMAMSENGAISIGMGGASADPNDESYQAMSPAEKEAYDLALHGQGQAVEVSEADEESTTVTSTQDEWDWESAGCFGRAMHKREQAMSTNQDPVTEVFNAPQWAELQEKIQELYEEEWEAEENGDTFVEYAACMDKKGFSGINAPNDAMTKAADMVMEAKVWDTPDGQPDPAAQKKVKPEEIELAVADFTCQKDTDVAGKRLALKTKLQQAFVDENRDELEAFVAALQAAGGE